MCGTEPTVDSNGHGGTQIEAKNTLESNRGYMTLVKKVNIAGPSAVTRNNYAKQEERAKWAKFERVCELLQTCWSEGTTSFDIIFFLFRRKQNFWLVDLIYRCMETTWVLSEI